MVENKMKQVAKLFGKELDEEFVLSEHHSIYASSFIGLIK